MAAAAFALPMLLVVYLALRNGGYDLVPTAEVGLVSWWLLLVGILVGVLPRLRFGALAGGAAILLAGLAVWTALSLIWTESSERTMIELARVATYLGLYLLGVTLATAGYRRPLAGGVTLALAAVVVLAALSRMEPSWFPEQNVGEFLPDVELESRLAYPMNYSSGLAATCGIAIPLLLVFAASGRTWIARSLAVATLPVAALTLWLTGSSLAIPVVVVGLGSYLLLTDERIPAVASLAIGGLGGGVLIAAASTRGALDRGLTTPEAQSQGNELLVITLIVCAAAIVASALLDRLLSRNPRLRGPLLSRGAARAALAVAVAVLAVGAIAAGVPGELADRLDEFRSAEGLDPDEGARGEQVLDVSARGRYQYWEAALDAYGTEPILGIGPGTFEFYWAREGDPDAAIFVRDAHSLYFEALAELGPVGSLLVLALVALILIGGFRVALAATGRRLLRSALLAACLVFAAVAAVDWIWELAAVGGTFFLLAAALLGKERIRQDADEQREPARRVPLGRTALLVAPSLAALVAIAIPFGGATLVEQSREAADDDDLVEALELARDASAVQPGAATPRIQKATVLELIGDLDGAVDAALEATEREPTNWRLWLVLSRLQARNGDAEAAVESFERGQSLFPRGDLTGR